MNITVNHRYTERGQAKERRTVIVDAVSPTRIDWHHVYVPSLNPYLGRGSTMPLQFAQMFKEEAE